MNKQEKNALLEEAANPKCSPARHTEILNIFIQNSGDIQQKSVMPKEDEPDVVGICRLCGGCIVREKTHTLVPVPTGSFVCGGRNPTITSAVTYCRDCGIMYHL